MKKNVAYLLYMISSIPLFGAAGEFLPAEQSALLTSDLDLARACQLTYQLEKCGFERDDLLDLTHACGLQRYVLWDSETVRPEEHPEDIGFQAVTLVDESSRDVIIAFRGTDVEKVGNILMDLAIVGAQLSDANPLDVLAKHVDAFLQFYTKQRTLGHVAAYTFLKQYGLPRHVLSVSTGAELYGAYAPQLISFLKAVGYDYIAEVPDKSFAFLHQAVKQALAYVARTELLLKRNAAQMQQQSWFSQITHYVYNRFGMQPEPEELRYNVTITGHSLGGFIAQIVGAHSGHRTVTFNAPGAHAFFEAYAGEFGVYEEEISDSYVHIRNIIRADDIVGNFGNHLGAKELFQNWLPGLTLDMQMKYHAYMLRYHTDNPLTIEEWIREMHGSSVFDPIPEKETAVPAAGPSSSEPSTSSASSSWWDKARSVASSMYSVTTESPRKAYDAIKQRGAKVAAYLPANHSIKNLADDMHIVDCAHACMIAELSA